MLKSIFESEIRDEFMKGEHGGEAFYDLPNDYKPIDALRYFAINVVAGKEDISDDIWEKKVQDINANRADVSELDGCKKYVLTCTTTLDNCRLPYSFWLAGRFDGKEWEVRIKDEKKLKLISTEEIEFEE